MAAPYELIYYAGVPGRGEHVRLILEEAGAPYRDTQSLSFDEARRRVTTWLAGGGHGNPRYFAPPLLKHGDLVISQTPNILLYLGPKLGLAGSGEDDVYRVNALALTALDGLSDEVHDSHHPIAVMLPYEDQKEESRRRSKQWVQNRLPSHLAYWQKVLEDEEQGPGPWLLGSTFTYADLVLFQCLDGTHYAFPKAMRQARDAGKYDRVFKLWEDVKARPNVAAYLASNRRQRYQDWGVYRHYDDNDVVAE
ncbi:glutathione S-transferase protein-like protein [Annulohypoxylon bovei var. microspora]|nr:glutathione S-transferase protein-like protein [Annulohypoxylon bovei var. microspora]